LDFSGETKDLILELIGMLAIKSPEMREHLSKPLIQIAKMTMAMTMETKERWESQIAQVKADTGEDISNGKTYEEMKEFVERQEFDISVNKEHQIHMELIGMQQITELLHRRNWTLVKAGKESGEFITTDNPVSLA
jgi:thymidine phosphorylase